MGRLVISHHKSYHPYRRDNIERVRQDEEDARRKEEGEDARIMLADSEARIALLRKRDSTSAVASGSHGARDDDEPARAADPPTAIEPIATTSTGHINLFADLEQQAMRAAIAASKSAAKGAAKFDAERGIPLAPTEKDLKPWYSSRDNDTDVGGPTDPRFKETKEERRMRDLTRKSQSDPLTSIIAQLSQSQSSSRPHTHSSRDRDRDRDRARDASRVTSIAGAGGSSDPVRERLSREASERARAAELIRRRRRETEGSMTPSTIAGGLDEGYSERYNRRDTEDAQRRRRDWDRRW